MAVLMLLLVDSSRGISGQRIRDQIALLGLNNNNAGVGSEKKRDIGAIAVDRVG